MYGFRAGYKNKRIKIINLYDFIGEENIIIQTI